MPEPDFQNDEHHSRMGFLLDTMSRNEGFNTLPSFAECVVLASLLGRCTAHRRLTQSTPLSNSESKLQDLWRRHEWLAAVVAASATAQRPSAQWPNPSADGEALNAKCNVMLSFNRILAYCASISLSNTAEAGLWQTFDDHLKVISYKQLAYQGASEVVNIINSIPRIAFLKVNHLSSYHLLHLPTLSQPFM